MKFGVFTDTLDENSDQESTLLLLNDLYERDHDVFISFPEDLDADGVYWRLYTGIDEPFEKNLHHRLINHQFPHVGYLQDLDAILFRKDQPIDSSQVQRIGNLYSDAVQINRADSVATLDKTYLNRFPEFTAETYFSSSPEEIRDHISRFGEAIVKPTDEGGGTGVHKVDSDTHNLEGIIDELTQGSRKDIVVQEFLPGVYRGDKRVMMLGNQVIDAYTRIPKTGSYMANIKQGATAHDTFISDQEYEIMESVLPQLQRDGLYHVGFDFIDDVERGPILNEINGTCVGFTSLKPGERYRAVTDAVVRTVNEQQSGELYQTIQKAS